MLPTQCLSANTGLSTYLIEGVAPLTKHPVYLYQIANVTYLVLFYIYKPCVYDSSIQLVILLTFFFFLFFLPRNYSLVLIPWLRVCEKIFYRFLLHVRRRVIFSRYNCIRRENVLHISESFGRLFFLLRAIYAMYARIYTYCVFYMLYQRSSSVSVYITNTIHYKEEKARCRKINSLGAFLTLLLLAFLVISCILLISQLVNCGAFLRHGRIQIFICLFC